MDVSRQHLKYIGESLSLVASLNVACYFVMRIWDMDLVAAMVASMLFVLVVDIATAFLWRWVVTKHKNMLPSFFTGVSGFRFLGALILLLIGYLMVGRDGMLTFICVFFVYYMLSIVHHSIFFSRMSKRV